MRINRKIKQKTNITNNKISRNSGNRSQYNRSKQKEIDEKPMINIIKYFSLEFFKIAVQHTHTHRKSPVTLVR